MLCFNIFISLIKLCLDYTQPNVAKLFFVPYFRNIINFNELSKYDWILDTLLDVLKYHVSSFSATLWCIAAIILAGGQFTNRMALQSSDSQHSDHQPCNLAKNTTAWQLQYTCTATKNYFYWKEQINTKLSIIGRVQRQNLADYFFLAVSYTSKMAVSSC